MAETGNTARMAEKLCDELFGEFLWTKVGPTNANWKCATPDVHEVTTHPTDVVYFYDEPYSLRRTYLQCDLKSYAKGSITSTAVRGALESLAMQVACAEMSDEWRSFYAHDHVTYAVTGLLVIYNHDGGYDANFSDNLAHVKTEDIQIPKDSKLVVLGPKEVYWLDNIRYEIRQMRGSSGSDKIPVAEHCRFFFPQLASRANLQTESAIAATLEMLTSPWVILEHRAPGEKPGMVIFYKREGKTTDEFMYLLDYLRQHGVFDEERTIRIKSFDADKTCPANFQKAAQRYVEEMSDGDGANDLGKRIAAVDFSNIPQVRSTFSTVEIGMDYEKNK
ncbi:hypothetical protein [Xanthomonas indica]|uniref:GAPS4 PD-(D/E)XK nuclease domain-containing protein n=1 Tax=Xanthomonas indica TaxID=2912242 RepID=A0AAU8I1Z1_9XANT|nr:hypothetical protein [Xanthomonas indica]MCI2260914.1 hypothetical protein [Xanthomonas indica]